MNSFAALGQHTPQACMYRAFNTYGYENFANPEFDGVSHYSTKPWQVNNNIDYNQGGDIFAEGKDGKKQVPKQREVKQ